MILLAFLLAIYGGLALVLGRTALEKALPSDWPVLAVVVCVVAGYLSGWLFVRLGCALVRAEQRRAVSLMMLLFAVLSGLMVEKGAWDNLLWELDRWLWLPTALGGLRECVRYWTAGHSTPIRRENLAHFEMSS